MPYVPLPGLVYRGHGLYVEQPICWTAEQLCVLLLLRARYAETRDLFSRDELARLTFYRWLWSRHHGWDAGR